MVAARKPQRRLAQTQISTLDLMYRFRFLNSELLARSEGKLTLAGARSRLNILHSYGYIGRRYSGADKLAGRPAAYYLLLDGIRALRPYISVHASAANRTAVDPSASQAFVDRCLHVCAIAVQLSLRHGPSLSIQARVTIQPEKLSLSPLPDLLMIRSSPVGGHSYIASIDLFEADTPFFVMIRRIKKCIHYNDSPERTDDASAPRVFAMVCPKESTRRRMHARIDKEVATTAYVRIVFATSTLLDVHQIRSSNDPVWHMADGRQDDEARFSLNDVFTASTRE